MRKYTKPRDPHQDFAKSSWLFEDIAAENDHGRCCFDLAAVRENCGANRGGFG